MLVCRSEYFHYYGETYSYCFFLLFYRSWDSDLMPKVSKMVSFLLFITLTVPLSSLGRLIQNSHSLDNSDSVRKTRSTGKSDSAPDSLSSEVIFHSESSRDSLEGSGQSADSVDRTASQTLINRTVIPKEPEPAGNEKHSGSGISLTTTPALSLHQSGAHDQVADRSNKNNKFSCI